MQLTGWGKGNDMSYCDLRGHKIHLNDLSDLNVHAVQGRSIEPAYNNRCKVVGKNFERSFFDLLQKVNLIVCIKT